MKRKTDYQTIAYSMLLSAACSVPLAAQSTPTPAAPSTEPEKEEVIVLSPFEVTTEESEGYTAATTLAGNRLNTELRDIGSAVQVVTSQFMKDTGALNNETLLQYTTGTEVGNVFGNFAGLGDGAQLNETDRFKNPNQNTRVRGLTSADNTRDYFTTDIPWDSYSVDRVDLQRGPNSILFGQGSPAGIINNGTKQAGFRNSGELEVRLDNNGTVRASIDLNRELIDDQLAVRIALLRDDQQFRQDPAFQLSKRGFGALRWEPAFLKKGSARTIVKMNAETGSIDSNRPRNLPPGDLITPWFRTGTVQGRFALSGEVAGVRPIDPVTGQLV
jgi:outer membrane receptor for ferric coprogen and ferric-rhodotorulic acid